MTSFLYEKEYTIPVYDIGADGKLNPHSLFNYLQDIASEHAVRLRFGKDDLMKENKFWVLSRIAASFAEWPAWEDKIIVRTWPRGTDKLFALRDFTIMLPGNKVIASASSSWLVVDRTSRRVQRPDSLLSGFTTAMPSEGSMGRNAIKLEPVQQPEKPQISFRVKTSDLDINLHTNNVNYIKWVTDIYSPDFRLTHIPRLIEVNYLAESRWNDEIVVKTGADNSPSPLSTHVIERSTDETELCRIRIEWENCSQ